MPPNRSGMGHHHLSLLSFCNGVDSWYMVAWTVNTWWSPTGTSWNSMMDLLLKWDKVALWLASSLSFPCDWQPFSWHSYDNTTLHGSSLLLRGSTDRQARIHWIFIKERSSIHTCLLFFFPFACLYMKLILPLLAVSDWPNNFMYTHVTTVITLTNLIP